MKSHFMRFVLTTGLTVLGSLALSAQERSEIAKVPFAFNANQHSFAAGEYRVERVNHNGVFQILNRTDGSSAFVAAQLIVDSKTVTDPHLTFACYQGNCVLKEIWMPGSDIGYRRGDSAVDKDLQRHLGMATMINVRLAR